MRGPRLTLNLERRWRRMFWRVLLRLGTAPRSPVSHWCCRACEAVRRVEGWMVSSLLIKSLALQTEGKSLF